MRAGVSKEDITPPVGIRMGGFAMRYRGSEGVHDALYTRTLYIEGKEESLMLIANDLLNIPDSLALEVKEELSRNLGIRVSAILISATHTHSGPSLPPDISADVPGADAEEYLNSLRDKIVGAAFESVKNARVARLGWGLGRVVVSFNRRNFGGPVDPDVNALLVVDESGRPFASLVNYACHGVVLGDTNYLISADYPGVVSRVIEKRLGPDHVSLFTNGATGDLNPLTSAGYTCPGSFEDVEAIGRVVAYAALNAIAAAKMYDEPIIRSTERVVPIPLVKLSKEMALKYVEHQDRVLSELKASNASVEDFMRNEALLKYYRKNLDIISTKTLESNALAKLQSARVGDALLIAIPGEPLVEVGMRIKGRSPFKPTLIISYANGYCGYIATSEAYEHGGYEVTTTWWNRLAKGAAEIIIEESLSLAKELM